MAVFSSDVFEWILETFSAFGKYEIGMIKSTPQKLIAQGTDWRFFNQLRLELKA